MAANTNPLFELTPHIGMVSIATANTNRDGTGTLGSVFVGATNGSRIDRIIIEATATTAAGVVTLFIYDNSSITNLWKEVLVGVVTASATSTAFTATIISPDPMSPLLVLPASYVLKAGTTIAQTFVVTALGGDF